MMEKHRCCAKIFGGYESHRCVNSAKVERDGEWYCGMHDPVAVEQKRKARDLEWLEKFASERSAEQEKQKAKAEIERRAGCFDSLVEALETLMDWQKKNVKCYSNPAYDNAHRVLKKATGAE